MREMTLAQFLSLDAQTLSNEYNKAKCLTRWTEITNLAISEDEYISAIKFCSKLKSLGCWFNIEFNDYPSLSHHDNLNWPWASYEEFKKDYEVAAPPHWSRPTAWPCARATFWHYWGLPMSSSDPTTALLDNAINWIRTKTNA